ncbi:MAG: hypothetical protein RIS13_565, partial [Bacteroidota bacterium]
HIRALLCRKGCAKKQEDTKQQTSFHMIGFVLKISIEGCFFEINQLKGMAKRR